MSSFFGGPLTLLDCPDQELDSRLTKSRCPGFIAFLAIFLEDDTGQHLKFQPILTNKSFEWPDFDVVKVRYSTFPVGLDDIRSKGREFVAVKLRGSKSTRRLVEDVYSELVIQLEVLRHAPLQKHQNIIDLLGAIYHDAGDIDLSNIIPALVLEFAELGSVKEYQLNGDGTSFTNKLDIIRDAARGIEALHFCSIIHGDATPSNLLVVRRLTRKFIVKHTVFGFAVAEIIGYTEYLEASEEGTPIDL
jgi:hypothetical protein